MAIVLIPLNTQAERNTGLPTWDTHSYYHVPRRYDTFGISLLIYQPFSTTGAAQQSGATYTIMRQTPESYIEFGLPEGRLGTFKPWGPDAVNTSCTIAIMPLDLTLNNKCLGYIYITCKNYNRLNCHLTIIGRIPYTKYFKFCETEIQNYSIKNTLCSKKGKEQITLNQQKKNS